MNAYLELVPESYIASGPSVHSWPTNWTASPSPPLLQCRFSGTLSFDRRRQRGLAYVRRPRRLRSQPRALRVRRTAERHARRWPNHVKLADLLFALVAAGLPAPSLHQHVLSRKRSQIRGSSIRHVAYRLISCKLVCHLGGRSEITKSVTSRSGSGMRNLCVSGLNTFECVLHDSRSLGNGSEWAVSDRGMDLFSLFPLSLTIICFERIVIVQSVTGTLMRPMITSQRQNRAKHKFHSNKLYRTLLFYVKYAYF